MQENWKNMQKLKDIFERSEGYLMLGGLQVHLEQCLLCGTIMSLFACILNQQVKMQDQSMIKLRF